MGAGALRRPLHEGTESRLQKLQGHSGVRLQKRHRGRCTGSRPDL